MKVFGNNLVSGWKKSLQDFEFSHKKIPDITKPLKVHVLTAHVSEFNEQYGKSKALGFYSEQTGEAVHQKFESKVPVFSFFSIRSYNTITCGKKQISIKS